MTNLKSTKSQKNKTAGPKGPAFTVRAVITGLAGILLLALAGLTLRMTEPKVSQSFADDNRKTDAVTPDLPVIQQFVPQHEKLAGVGFVLDRKGGGVSQGSVAFKIYDTDLNIVYETEFAMADIEDGSYTDVPLDLRVRPGEIYYFRIETKDLAGDAAPSLAYRSLSGCGPEENTLLYYGSTVLEDGSAVCRYEYGMRISPLQFLACMSFYVFLGVTAAEAAGGFRRKIA